MRVVESDDAVIQHLHIMQVCLHIYFRAECRILQMYHNCEIRHAKYT